MNIAIIYNFFACAASMSRAAATCAVKNDNNITEGKNRYAIKKKKNAQNPRCRRDLGIYLGPGRRRYEQ